MLYFIRRLAERGVAARRGNAEFIRRALCDDLLCQGEVDAVQGDTLMALQGGFVVNEYGRFVSQGVTTPGETLRFEDGDAAGQTFELLETLGRKIRVVDDVDLEAAGVKVGDHYRILRGQEDRAIDWFAGADIRVIVGWPTDPATVPLLSVVKSSDDELSRPIGDGRRRGPDVPSQQNELRSTWSERYSVRGFALTPDAVCWLTDVFLHLYRHGTPAFSRAFSKGDTRAQAGEPTYIDGLKAWMREVTITGTTDRVAAEELEWYLDQEQPTVTIEPKRVNLPNR